MINRILLCLTLFLLTVNFTHAETLVVYGTEGDGQIRTPDATDWSIAHSATIGDEIYYDIGSVIAQVRKGSGGVRNINRAFFSFDTSIIPEGAVITSAKFVGYVVGKNNDVNDEYSYIGVYEGFQSSTDVIIESDIDKCGNNLINPEIGSNKVLVDSVAELTTVDFILNNDGRSWINKNGFTKLCLREGHDAENIEYNPAGSFLYNDIGIRAADWIGLNQDPRLEISYTIPAVDIDTPVNLIQKRVDVVSALEEGDSFIGNGVVFSADVGIDDGGLMRGLEVEVKQMGEDFDENNTHTSDLSSASVASVVVSDFFSKIDLYSGNNEGDFKWRARSVDEEGNKSDWVMFGNDEKDFSLRAVPLMTQVSSSFPNLVDTTAWSQKDYAFGNSICGSSSAIAGCGCALSSLSTIGRFYGIINGVDGAEVNPDNLNEWLKANKGFDKNENINWTAAMKYFGLNEGGKNKQFLTISGHLTQIAAINAALSDGPIIAKSNPAGYTHFFTIDSVLDTGYEISDSYWFNTQYTNQDRDYANDLQDYNDIVQEAKDIQYHSTPVLTKKSLEIHLASPAEFVVTDSEGKKFGYDPRTDTTYEEIATSDYWHEADVASGQDQAPADVHITKYGWVLDVEDGQYTIEVIGTGSGRYDLSVLLTEEGGESTQLEFSSSTSEGEIHAYLVNFGDDENNEVSNEDKLQAFIDWKRSKLEYMPRFIARIIESKLNRLERRLNDGKIKFTKGNIKLLDKWYEEYKENPDHYWPFLGLLYSLYNKNK